MAEKRLVPAICDSVAHLQGSRGSSIKDIAKFIWALVPPEQTKPKIKQIEKALDLAVKQNILEKTTNGLYRIVTNTVTENVNFPVSKKTNPAKNMKIKSKSCQNSSDYKDDRKRRPKNSDSYDGSDDSNNHTKTIRRHRNPSYDSSNSNSRRRHYNESEESTKHHYKYSDRRCHVCTCTRQGRSRYARDRYYRKQESSISSSCSTGSKLYSSSNSSECC